jgi:glyoxylase-like metal-dependent hydrolase (beta-lactamase superfamily II)
LQPLEIKVFRKMTKSKYTIHTLDLGFLGHTDTIAAFLIEAGKDIILIETGPHSTYPILKKAVEKLGFSITQINHVFLSHIHFDHAGAAWCFAPHATIYVHPMGEKHLVDPTKLYNSAKLIYKERMDELWGDMQGIPAEKIHATTHGEKIQVGNINLTAWHTPGHAVHHIAWQLSNELFTGDIAGVKIGEGIVVPPCPPPDINIEDWRASLQLIRELNVKTLHLTHFGKITTPKKHLNALETRLVRWANWMKIRHDKGLTADKVTPQYQAYTKKELARHGIVGAQYAQYEAANPAWMSVVGLMRYWLKKS